MSQSFLPSDSSLGREPLIKAPSGDFDPVREIRNLRLSLADRLRALQAEPEASPVTSEPELERPINQVDSATVSGEHSVAEQSVQDSFVRRLDEAQRLLALLQPTPLLTCSEACGEADRLGECTQSEPKTDNDQLQHACCRDSSGCCGESVGDTGKENNSASEIGELLETMNLCLTFFGVAGIVIGALFGFLAPQSGVISPLIVAGVLLTGVGVCGRLLARLPETPISAPGGN